MWVRLLQHHRTVLGVPHADLSQQLGSWGLNEMELHAYTESQTCPKHHRVSADADTHLRDRHIERCTLCSQNYLQSTYCSHRYCSHSHALTPPKTCTNLLHYMMHLFGFEPSCSRRGPCRRVAAQSRYEATVDHMCIRVRQCGCVRLFALAANMRRSDSISMFLDFERYNMFILGWSSLTLTFCEPSWQSMRDSPALL